MLFVLFTKEKLNQLNICSLLVTKLGRFGLTIVLYEVCHGLSIKFLYFFSLYDSQLFLSTSAMKYGGWHFMLSHGLFGFIGTIWSLMGRFLICVRSLILLIWDLFIGFKRNSLIKIRCWTFVDFQMLFLPSKKWRKWGLFYNGQSLLQVF